MDGHLIGINFLVHKHAQIDTKEKKRKSNKFYTECTDLQKIHTI